MNASANTLRRALGRLGRRRRVVRLGSAWLGLGVVVPWLAALAFLADWSLEMSVAQRLVLLAICAGLLVVAFRRYTLAWLFRREDTVDIALLVERRQQIDGDLVAALQFDSPAAATWGSEELREAVVEYVADFSRGFDVFAGHSGRRLSRRLVAFVASVGFVLGAAALAPQHARAFLARMALGAEHYPTRTVLERIAVNGRALEERGSKQPHGAPLVFEVWCSGELPESGLVELTSLEHGTETRVELRPQGSEDGEASSDTRRFSGALPRLLEPVSFQVFAGDAWTDARRIDVIPLAIVDVELVATPPRHAAAREEAPSLEAGARQLSVLEGSRVDLTLHARNKRLRSARLGLLEQSWELASDDGRAWRLVVEGTPFEAVTETVRFSIEAVDEDGLELERPLQGVVRIRPDQRPRISVAVVTRHVLPSARPTISWGAADDWGVASVRARVEITRLDGAPQESVETLYERAADGAQLDVVRGEYRLDLARFGLAKGDRLKVVLEATDERGEREGDTVAGDPVLFEVTDERGVLAAMVESDERSARQLDAIIERQLGIGKR